MSKRRGTLLIHNGRIRTGKPGAVVEALLIEDGRVTAVGDVAQVRAAAPHGIRELDLDGASVVPGLVDTHPHLMHFSSFYGPTVNIMDACGHDDIVRAISDEAATKQPGDWICTTPAGEPHYFRRRSWRTLTEGELPDRDVLDRAAPDNPVIIQAWAPVFPNVTAVNTRALELLGIDRSSPDRVSGVHVEKDARGEPTGRLLGAVTTYYNDDPYWAELSAKMPDLIQPETIPHAFAASSARYNDMGITTVFEAHEMDVPEIEIYKSLRSQQLLSLRTMVSHSLEVNALPINSPKSLDEVRAGLAHAFADRSVSDDWLRVDGITTCAQGPLACGRMAWRAGYEDVNGEITFGDRQISEEKMQIAVDFCAEHGLRLNLLSCSPEEHDQYIEWTRSALAKHGRTSSGWLIEHGYVMRPDQPAKLRELGFDITISAGFKHGKGELIETKLGAEALTWLNPLRRMIDSGMHVAASNDWGPTNPFEQMAIAVTHEMQPSGRRNDGPDQVVTREEAFLMWTGEAGKVLRWGEVGTLVPGSYGDFVIVDRDPVTCDVDDLPMTRVLSTYIDGRAVRENAPQEEV